MTEYFRLQRAANRTFSRAQSFVEQLANFRAEVEIAVGYSGRQPDEVALLSRRLSAMTPLIDRLSDATGRVYAAEEKPRTFFLRKTSAPAPDFDCTYEAPHLAIAGG